MARCALVNRGLRDVVGAVPYRLYVVGMLVADLGAVGQQTAWRFAERIACDSLASPPTDLCVVGALVADTPHPSLCGDVCVANSHCRNATKTTIPLKGKATKVGAFNRSR